MGTIIIVFLLLIGLPVAAGVAVAARPLSSTKLIRRAHPFRACHGGHYGAGLGDAGTCRERG